MEGKMDGAKLVLMVGSDFREKIRSAARLDNTSMRQLCIRAIDREIKRLERRAGRRVDHSDAVATAVR